MIFFLDFLIACHVNCSIAIASQAFVSIIAIFAIDFFGSLQFTCFWRIQPNMAIIAIEAALMEETKLGDYLFSIINLKKEYIWCNSHTKYFPKSLTLAQIMQWGFKMRSKVTLHIHEQRNLSQFWINEENLTSSSTGLQYTHTWKRVHTHHLVAY